VQRKEARTQKTTKKQGFFQRSHVLDALFSRKYIKRLRMRRFFARYILVSALLFPSVTMAQLVIGARETAMGQAITAIPDAQWTVFNNPAAMSRQERSVQFYSIRYYSLSELTDVAFQIAMPVTKTWTAAAGVHHFGGDVYSESRFRAGFGGNTGKLSVGGTLTLNTIRYAGPYQNAATAGIDAGVQYKASPKLTLGARSVNLAGGKISNAPAEPARELAVGAAYKPSPTVLFALDYVKDIRFDPDLRFGTELTVMEVLSIRLGKTTAPGTFSVGLGLKHSRFVMNFVMQRHQESSLGVSPGLDFQWKF
jgi:hypothetical protein